MTTEAILKENARKKAWENAEGIMLTIMQLRIFLSKMEIVPMHKSPFTSIAYIKKYSPLFNKKVE